MIILLLLLALQAHSQTAGTIEIPIPCYPRVCKATFPVVTDAEGNSTLALPSSGLTRAEVAQMIADAVGKIPAPPAPVEACPGPLLSQVDGVTVAVGSRWSLATPCIIRHALDRPDWGAGPMTLITADLRLVAETRFVFSSTQPCTAWFYIFRNSVDVAGRCLAPDGKRISSMNVPPIGAFLLGYAHIYGGRIRELAQPDAPQLPPLTWDRSPVQLGGTIQ